MAFRRDAEDRSLYEPQDFLCGAAEENGFHIVGIPLASHDDHLNVVFDGFVVDFDAWYAFADHHLCPISIHTFRIEKRMKLAFRIHEQLLFDIFLTAQALLNAILDETLIDDMKHQDFPSLARSPRFRLPQGKSGAGREIDPHKNRGAVVIALPWIWSLVFQNRYPPFPAA
jgi:hypothetical protein